MKIIQEDNIIGVIKSEGTLFGSVNIPNGYDDYSGTYTVTPNSEKQTLQTIDKHLTENVVVKEIPYYDVSNEQGGSTIIIGGNI